MAREFIAAPPSPAPDTHLARTTTTRIYNSIHNDSLQGAVRGAAGAGSPVEAWPWAKHFATPHGSSGGAGRGPHGAGKVGPPAALAYDSVDYPTPPRPAATEGTNNALRPDVKPGKSRPVLPRA